jgi:hypothetical protein
MVKRLGNIHESYLAILEPQIGTQKEGRRTEITYKCERKNRPWQDSNLQSPDPKSGALSIMPHDLLSDNKHVRPLAQPVFQLILKYFIFIFIWH